jgi:hypothetical protein
MCSLAGLRDFPKHQGRQTASSKKTLSAQESRWCPAKSCCFISWAQPERRSARKEEHHLVEFYNTIIYEVLSTHFFLYVQKALAPDASIHAVKQALKGWNQIALEKPDEESWMA